MSSTFACIYCHKEHPRETSLCPETSRPLSPVHKLSSTVIEGKLRIEKLIGEGGMGVIYESVHLEIGRRFAVKFLNPALGQSKDAYNRFRREAKAAAIVSHKNIVDVVDVGLTADGLPFIVMQYLEGEDLQKRVAGTGSLAIREAAGIIAQALEGLEAVHSAGIIHRDLKPENIFLARQSGGSEIVKILDFGVSKLTASKDLSMETTSSGQLLGTPYYTSPEQAEGKSAVDHRVDLYSAGVIFYEMITGRLPFSNTAYGKLLLEIASIPVPDPRLFIPDLPDDIRAFVLKSMAKSPLERFQSASEMLAALRALELKDCCRPAPPVAVARLRLETKNALGGKDRPTPVQEVYDIKHQETLPPPETPAPSADSNTPRKVRTITGKTKPSAGTYRLVAERKRPRAENNGGQAKPDDAEFPTVEEDDGQAKQDDTDLLPGSDEPKT